MKNKNHKSLNIPRPVLKRQTNQIHEIFDEVDIPRPIIKRQTTETLTLDKIDIPEQILKKQINEAYHEVGLPIFYSFCDSCNFSTITNYKNVENINKTASIDVFLDK